MNDIKNASLYGRIINLSNVSEEKAFEMAKGHKIVSIRIQGKVEHTLRKVTKNIVKSTILNIARSVNKRSKYILDSMDSKGDFSRKFTDEQIEKMAIMFPRNKKMTIESVQEYFSMLDLSWRQAKKIIDKEKESFPSRNRGKEKEAME